MEGWIKLHRQICDDELYLSEKFDKTHAWIDLLLLAARQKRTFSKRGIEVTLEVGEVAVSIRELAQRWQWSVNTVQSFLKRLILIHRIAIHRSKIINVINICNYKKYQQIDTQTDTQIDTQTDTLHKNDKNINNKKEKIEKEKSEAAMPQKHRYAPEVLMTEAEYSKLVQAYGQDGASWMVKKLDDYKAASGRTYKSDYRAILNWVVKEYQKQVNQYGSTTNWQGNQADAKRQRDEEFARHIAEKLGGDGLH